MNRHGENKDEVQLPRRSRVSRREFLGATAGVASALGLAAQGAHARPARAVSARSQEAVTLEVWGFNRERLNFAENAAGLPVFKDKYPNVLDHTQLARPARADA